MGATRIALVVGDTEVPVPDEIEYNGTRYVPAPPEGAPSWEELAEAVLFWRAVRGNPADDPDRQAEVVRRFTGLADRLRPACRAIEAEQGD